MINDPPINKLSKTLLDEFVAEPSQAVGLIGQKWLGKGSVARLLASRLLQLESAKLASYPYLLALGGHEVSSISIEEIRQLNSFLSLKVPSKATLNRVVLIEDADKLTIEAQNALLKNLEEPPAGTVIILTAEAGGLLLPTILSRLTLIRVLKPTKAEVAKYYQDQGYSEEAVSQALLIADGLPGLMDLLISSEDNPFNQAIIDARKILSSSTFERLTQINDLARDKQSLKDVLFILKQMAKISVASPDPKTAGRWQNILAVVLDSELKLAANGQTKLVLTDLMLSLG